MRMELSSTDQTKPHLDQQSFIMSENVVLMIASDILLIPSPQVTIVWYGILSKLALRASSSEPYKFVRNVLTKLYSSSDILLTNFFAKSKYLNPLHNVDCIAPK